MASLKSWTCKGCTNVCYRSFNGEVFEYCKPAIERGKHRTEWQGDYIACLEYTADPDATDTMVRLHPDMLKRYRPSEKQDTIFDLLEAQGV